MSKLNALNLLFSLLLASMVGIFIGTQYTLKNLSRPKEYMAADISLGIVSLMFLLLYSINVSQPVQSKRYFITRFLVIFSVAVIGIMLGIMFSYRLRVQKKSRDLYLGGVMTMLAGVLLMIGRLVLVKVPNTLGGTIMTGLGVLCLGIGNAIVTYITEKKMYPGTDTKILKTIYWIGWGVFALNLVGAVVKHTVKSSPPPSK